MPFLDNYEGTEKLDVGHGYWIEIKLCLSREEKRAADSFMSRMSATEVDGDGPRSKKKMVARATPDIERYREEIVIASIVDWNLDDEHGVWQLSPASAKRRNVGRLPDSVFDIVYKRANELNKKPDPEDQRSFRDGAARRDHDADADDDDAADRGEVPAGAGDVDEAWFEPGGAGAASVA